MDTTETTGTTGTPGTPCEGCGKAWDPLVDGIAHANETSAYALREVKRLTGAIIFAMIVVTGLYVWKGRP